MISTSWMNLAGGEEQMKRILTRRRTQRRVGEEKSVFMETLFHELQNQVVAEIEEMRI